MPTLFEPIEIVEKARDNIKLFQSPAIIVGMSYFVISALKIIQNNLPVTKLGGVSKTHILGVSIVS